MATDADRRLEALACIHYMVTRALLFYDGSGPKLPGWEWAATNAEEHRQRVRELLADPMHSGGDDLASVGDDVVVVAARVLGLLPPRPAAEIDADIEAGLASVNEHARAVKARALESLKRPSPADSAIADAAERMIKSIMDGLPHGAGAPEALQKRSVPLLYAIALTWQEAPFEDAPGEEEFLHLARIVWQVARDNLASQRS